MEIDPLIRYGPETCGDLRVSLELEWLETNGIGGYAASTVAGAHTRRYHGLLVAVLATLARPFLLLSKLEETVVIGGKSWDLSLNIYPNAIHPQGHLLLKEFRIGPFPTFTYANESFELRKTILMTRGENSVLVRYELLRSGAPIRLEVRPLLAVREYDALTMENPDLNPDFLESGNRLIFHPYSALPPFQVAHNAMQVRKTGYWYRSLQYTAETERGRPAQEDLFNPCILSYEPTADRTAWLLASVKLSGYREDTISGLLELEDFRRRNLTFIRRQRAIDNKEEVLLRAADQFLVRKADDNVSLVAGYPTLITTAHEASISLPGIALVTGRWDEARKILLSLARASREGLLPDAGSASGAGLSSPDAGLWFIYALDRYLKYTADMETVSADLYPVMKQIIRSYRDGVHRGIRMDSDGMIECGEADHHPAVWRIPATCAQMRGERRGKRVEIQALWYNALSTATFLAQNLEGTKVAREFSYLARLCKTNFVRGFWNPETRCLFDCVEDGTPDAAIRPFQVLAVGLPDSMLGRKEQRQVVQAVERELLVPCGLRSLSTRGKGYRGKSSNGLSEPDAACHEGSAWSWYLGPFANAYLRAFGKNERTRKYVQALLEPFWQHLRQFGLGSVSERFDGDPPHAPRGCFAHAAGLAELVRVYFEIVRTR